MNSLFAQNMGVKKIKHNTNGQQTNREIKNT